MSSIARTSVTIAAATILSRLLGFARDVLIAASLGAGPAADALLVALRIPNLVRRVLGEGAVNGAFVPLHGRLAARDGPDAARRFAGEALAGLALLLLAVVGLAEAAASLLVLGLASGFADDPDRLALATAYSRWTTPLIAASSLSALASAILAAQGRLRIAALAPVLVNAVLVLVLLGLARSPAPPESVGLTVAMAVSAAGLAQLLATGAALFGGQSRPAWVRPRLSGELRRFLALAGPGVVTAASAQLSILAALQLASREPSSFAQLHYADRLFQLPLGFVAAGAGIVLLNEIVRLTRAGDHRAVGPLLDRALLAALSLAIPGAAGLAVLAGPITSILFERGAFSPADAAATAGALAALSVGLPAAAAARVFAQAFLAREAVRPPMIAAAAALAVTILAGLALQPAAGVAGVAGAVSLGALVDALALAAFLARLQGWTPGREALRRCAVCTTAALGMAAAVVAGRHALAGWLDAGQPALVRAAALTGLCAGGAALYAGLALAMGAARWRKRAP
ncbi:murein biosynthesis integral membrane protein MurJ [Alsobacter sp. SYSU BS001988]